MASASARFKEWLCDDGESLRRGRFLAVLVAIYAFFSITYIPINLFSVGRRAHTLYLPDEDRIPFLPYFEYLYALTFLIPALLVVTIRTYGRFLRLLRALGVALLIAYSTYLLYPVYMERPRLEPSSLHAWLLSLQYLDKPYNDFPSLHVILSWLAVYSADVTPRSRAGLVCVAIGVSISTLFVKQHYIADVVFGYVIAAGAWKLSGVARNPTSMKV